jgi:hypothetical protein
VINVVTINAEVTSGVVKQQAMSKQVQLISWFWVRRQNKAVRLRTIEGKEG